jgi:hypothetical protein
VPQQKQQQQQQSLRRGGRGKKQEGKADEGKVKKNKVPNCIDTQSRSRIGGSNSGRCCAAVAAAAAAAEFKPPWESIMSQRLDFSMEFHVPTRYAEQAIPFLAWLALAGV